jgi:hypothetical protein
MHLKKHTHFIAEQRNPNRKKIKAKKKKKASNNNDKKRY